MRSKMEYSGSMDERINVAINLAPEHSAGAIRAALAQAGFSIIETPNHGWDAGGNRFYEPVEDRAKEIYQQIRMGNTSIVPEWVPHGNSIMQDRCRITARRELRSEGH